MTKTTGINIGWTGEHSRIYLWVELLLSFSNLLRLVDCDMLIRYHWGLATEHVYTHSHQNSPNAPYAYFPNEETNILEGGSTYRLEPGIQSEEATMDGVSEGGLGGREAEDLLDASEEEDETDSEM